MIPCACCGKKILAVRVGNTIEIKSSVRGVTHMVVIHLDMLDKTTTSHNTNAVGRSTGKTLGS